MVEVEINLKDMKKALKLKRHLEKTHPSIRGKVSVDSKKVKSKKIEFGSAKFINKMLKNTPDFIKSAARFGG